MTDDRVTRQKWLAAAGIAPVAAAAFGFATSFAIAHQPGATAVEPQPVAASAVVQAGPGIGQTDPQQASIAGATAELNKLRAHVRGLRKQLKQANAKPPPVVVAAVGPSTSSGYSAAAPVSHGSTGASGH